MREPVEHYKPSSTKSSCDLALKRDTLIEQAIVEIAERQTREPPRMGDWFRSGYGESGV